MSVDLLPWLGLFAQIAGALVLAFSGSFGLGARKYSERGTAAGLALFCAGCVSLAVYAVVYSHYLLTAVQVLAAILVSLGIARKAREKRTRP